MGATKPISDAPHPVLAACAAQRAQQDATYTIADAVQDARFYRRMPESIVSDAQAKRVIENLLSALEQNPSYVKAVSRGQRTFVLVEQDRAAPFAIRAWAEVAGSHGCPPEKVHAANAMAQTWSKTPTVTRKWPD